MHRHLCGESVFTAWCQARSHATALVTCTYFHYFRSGLFFCRILFQVIFFVLFLFMLSPRRSQHRLVLLFPVAPRICAYAHPYVFCLTSRSSRRRTLLRGFIVLLLSHWPFFTSTNAATWFYFFYFCTLDFSSSPSAD